MNYPIPSVSPATAERAMRPFIAGHVLEAIQHATSDPRYAGPCLTRWFRRNRKLGSRDRRVVADIVYTLIRYERWFVATGLLASALHPETDLSSAIAWLHKPTPLNNQQFDFQTHLSIPAPIAQEWMDRVTEPTKLADHYQQRAPIDLRINRARAKRPVIQRKLKQAGIASTPIADLPNGLRINDTANISSLGIYQQGLVEIQDAASQYFLQHVEQLCPLPTTILDYCAGAGGKALGLAAQGHRVFAHEPRTNAQKEIATRAKRAGVKLHSQLPNELVDVVLVDAPCSGTGRLRREPTLRWRWREEPPQSWVSQQNEILQSAAQYCKPEGIIVYATCSLMAAENSHTLDGYQAERQTIWGHQEQCDGFSWTVFTPEG